VLASDFFDFSVYLDAAEDDIEALVPGAFPAAPENRLPRRERPSSNPL